jgi:hypothetical protein
MRKIYLDDQYRCSVTNGENKTEIETDFFDGRCEEFIEGYCYIPKNEKWVNKNNIEFMGETIFPIADFNKIDSIQRSNERAALQMLGATGAEAPVTQAQAIQQSMVFAATKLNDAEALQNVCLFAQWSDTHEAYALGDRVMRNGILYKCLQPHTPQPDWTPEQVAALWVNVASPDEVWPLIPNPIPSTNPFMRGQKGSLADGTKYISRIDNNVWQPNAYPQGWEAVT